MFPTRDGHPDRSGATLAFTWCLSWPRSVNWNLTWVSFFPFLSDIEPPPARWKCGNPASLFFAGFPSPVERVGNSLFEFSTLSTGRHFHGAVSVGVLGAQRRGGRVRCAVVSSPLSTFFHVSPKSEVSSSKPCGQDGPGATISRSLDSRDLPFSAQASLAPYFLRIESPRISIR
jgi:hypothetical protein